MTSTRPPEGMPVLDAGAHRDAEAGSCLMEYVSVLAGERFTDRPRCTHPALAAVAWQVNDAVSSDARQQLATRAVTLIGLGRDRGVEVRPIVLATIARAGLAIDPANRFFPRLQRRLQRRAAAGPGRPGRGESGHGGRLATLLHVGPVNHACAHLLVAARVADLDAAARDRLLVALLDDTIAAVAQAERSAGVRRGARQGRRGLTPGPVRSSAAASAETDADALPEHALEAHLDADPARVVPRLPAGRAVRGTPGRPARRRAGPAGRGSGVARRPGAAGPAGRAGPGCCRPPRSAPCGVASPPHRRGRPSRRRGRPHRVRPPRPVPRARRVLRVPPPAESREPHRAAAAPA